MKYEETGIYYYCLNLGLQLQKRLDSAHSRLTYYAPAHALQRFGEPSGIRPSRLHKLRLPSLSGHSIWHSTYQHSDYLPSRSRNIRVLLTIHDLNFMHDEQIPDGKKQRYLANLQKRIDRTDAIVCVSGFGKSDVTRFCDTKGKPVLVIHNGSNTLGQPLLEQSSFRPRQPFLFSIGPIRRKKNFHALLPLVKRNRHLDLVIAGKPEEAEYVRELKAMARNEGIEGQLHLVGKVSESEKSWYYHHCRAFVMTSVAEGFGLPLIEAMSVGKPVFLSARTALPEIGSDAAFYFSDFSEEHMQESFLKGLRQYDTRNMSDRIKQRAAAFSWEHAADEYIKLYQELYKHR